MKQKRAVDMGFSPDRRKRRRQHRKAARELIKEGTLFNAKSPRGSVPWAVAQWHLAQARHI
jgi:hypothetical protein